MGEKSIVPIDTESKKQLATYDSYKHLKAVATDLYKSGLFTHLKNPQQAIAAVEFGRELGVPPMQSLQSLAVISGKMCMTSQLMLALAKENGYKIKIKKNDDKKCEIDFIDPDGNTHPVQFTMEEAKALGLSNRDNWKKQPENMLFWRTISKAIRRFAPETLLGVYTLEEMTGGEATTIEEIQEIPEIEAEDIIVEEIQTSRLPEDANQYLTVKEIKAYEGVDIGKIKGWGFEESPLKEIENREHLNKAFKRQAPSVLSIIRMVRINEKKYDWERFKQDVLISDVWQDLEIETKIKTIRDWMRNNEDK